MSTFPSAAERLDRAVTALLDGALPQGGQDPALRPLIEVATLLRAALAPVPAGARFEARLGERLAHAAAAPSLHGLADGMRTLRDAARRELRHPGRLLVTGALSSAAVGVGVTAYAVWRGNRRPVAPVLGLRHRSGHR